MTATTEIAATLRTLDNSMTLIVQPMPWLRTAAFALSLDGGCQAERDDQAGVASMVCEMIQRGAGRYSSRDLVATLDELGIDNSAGVSTESVSLNASMPADRLAAALEIHADIVRRPHLPADQLDDARQMAIQELRAIDDEPVSRLMRSLRQMQYGPRLGRPASGTIDSVQRITPDDVREFYEQHYHAGGAILAVAGNVDVDEVTQLAERLFADWRCDAISPEIASAGRPGYQHIDAGSSQTHIGFSFDSIPYGQPDYYRMRAGIGVLSDGMSSRLFDRVREQRGLCYSVSANCHSLRHTAAVFGYAGTTPQRAQETLEVTLAEIDHLTDDLTDDELQRWKVRMESNLIMEQESSGSRASSLAGDFYQVGRIVSLRELQSDITAITLCDVLEYYRQFPPRDFRIITSGPQPLTVPATR